MDTAAKPKRENRTIIVDFQNETTYVQLLGDGKAFLELVLAFSLSLGFQLKHKATCRGGGCLTRHSHYVRVRLGGLTIWRIQCTMCKAVFTVLPHFVLRYRQMRPEAARDALLATHGGLSLELCAVIAHISPMALYRLICAFGQQSLVTVLTRCGLPLPVYVLVDEKHSRCLTNKVYFRHLHAVSFPHEEGVCERFFIKLTMPARVLRPAPRSRAVCRRRTRSCPPPGAWAAAALARGRGGRGRRGRRGNGLGRGLPLLRRVRQAIAVPGPHEQGVADHPLQRVAEPAPRQRLLDLRPAQPVGLLPQQRQDGVPERGLRAGTPGGGGRQLLFQLADPPQRGGEEPPHHRVVVGCVQQDRGLLLEERARVRAQGVGRGRGGRR